MMTLPTRIELTDGERFLLPFHQPTAQRVMDAWNAAFLADIVNRKEAYKAASAASPEAASLWALTERFWEAEQAGEVETMAVLETESEAIVESHPNVLNPFLDVFDSEKILATEDLRAAYTCLWGEP
jgi:hypothetical protein